MNVFITLKVRKYASIAKKSARATESDQQRKRMDALEKHLSKKPRESCAVMCDLLRTGSFESESRMALLGFLAREKSAEALDSMRQALAEGLFSTDVFYFASNSLGKQLAPALLDHLKVRSAEMPGYETIMVLDKLAEWETAEALPAIYEAIGKGVFSKPLFDFAYARFGRDLSPVLCRPLFGRADVPEEIAAALVESADPRTIRDLCCLFWNSDKKEFRERILDILARIAPSEAWELFLPMLDRSEVWILELAMRGLFRCLGEAGALRYIRPFLAPRFYEGVRREAAVLLGKARDKESYSRIEELYASEGSEKKPDGGLRADCLEALSRIDWKKASREAFRALADEEADRWVAARALALVAEFEKGDSRSFARIGDFLKAHAGDDSAIEAIKALALVDEAKAEIAVLAFLEALDENYPRSVLIAALEFLYERAAKDSIVAARRCLGAWSSGGSQWKGWSKDRELELLVLRIVGKFGDEGDRAGLRPLLVDSEPAVRVAAAFSLALVGETLWKDAAKGEKEDFFRLAEAGIDASAAYIVEGMKRGSDRKVYAEMVQRLARANPAVLVPMWAEIAQMMKTPYVNCDHSDSPAGYQSSDCQHSDYHTDSGIGMDFPDKPPVKLSAKPAEF
jgi:HEAT repeat protein